MFYKNNIPWNKGKKNLPNNGGFKKGKLHLNYGKHLSKKIREKISIAKKNHPAWNKNTKGIMKAWNKGKKRPPFSDKWKKNMGKSRKGKPSGALGKHWILSEETKKKHSEHQKGNNNSMYGKLGELCPNWKGGITSINDQIRQSPEYKLWRSMIFERDDFTCQICGQVGGRLRANHIKLFSIYIELRLDLNNGITICEDCDNKYVLRREEDWESYFYFNLSTRELIEPIQYLNNLTKKQ